MRINIVDFNPLAHKFAHGGAPLSHKVRMPNGETKIINTTIQNGSLKSINRWAAGGRNPTAVCFDSPCPARKAFFAEKTEAGTDYKGGRSSAGGAMFEAMAMTRDLLNNSGVSCYQIYGYEADDLIKAAIDSTRAQYGTEVPIDVITNDQDLLPLVDDQVSVFIRSMKRTYAVSPEIEKNKYVQVTPDNFQEVVEDFSAYKTAKGSFYVPYNSILLYKILRGDSSDNIPGFKRAFPPRKVEQMLRDLEEAGYSPSELFRYGKSDTYFPLIQDFLEDYVDGDKDLLEGILKNYWGMNLNASYKAIGSVPARPPAFVVPPKTYSFLELARNARSLGINLPESSLY